MPRVSDEVLFIALILLMAVFVLVIILFVFAILIHKQRPTIELNSAQRAIIGALPKDIQSLNWVACVILATSVAWLDYSRELYVLNRTSLYTYFVWLAVFSPACIAVAWLRLTGIKWRQALLLFIWVPAAFCGIWLMHKFWLLLVFLLFGGA